MRRKSIAETVRTVSIGGITVTVTKKAVKSLRLRVLQDGTAALSVPLFVSDREADDFLASHATWLLNAVERVESRATPADPPLTDGSAVLLFGAWLPLTVILTDSTRKATFTVEDGRAVLTVCPGADEDRRRALVDRYRRAALTAFLAKRVPVWQDRTGLACASWSVRDMRTRWGSCSTGKRTIRFSLTLSRRTPPEIDSVILHELCHLRVPDHGPRFYALMAQYMPDHDARRCSLKSPILPPKEGSICQNK